MTGIKTRSLAKIACTEAILKPEELKNSPIRANGYSPLLPTSQASVTYTNLHIIRRF